MPYSSLTYAKAYKWISENRPKALNNALKLLCNKDVDLDQETEIYPPESNSIRGVVNITVRRIHYHFID